MVLDDHLFTLQVCHGSWWPFVHTTGLSWFLLTISCYGSVMVLDDHLFMLWVCHGSWWPFVHTMGLSWFLLTICSCYGSVMVLDDHLFMLWVCHGSWWPFVHTTGLSWFLLTICSCYGSVMVPRETESCLLLREANENSYNCDIHILLKYVNHKQVQNCIYYKTRTYSSRISLIIL